MPRTVIGLDVGTAAVRAAEIRFSRGGPALVRFGQVALTPGAVVAGEVVDAAAVSVAIKRLWREAGFKGKRVVTGVAGQRVVARTTEVPAMSDADIRSSLPFQVQELIPIPLEEAVIDHQVLEPVIGDDGSERLRILVVAAHRDLLRSLLAALEGAGLSAARVDLIPFALIRSLHAAGFDELAEDGDGATAEALVDIGGGVTNVVVHEHGVPRFLRSLTTGGVELTAAIATDLDVDYESAESLKRRVDDDEEAVHARQVMTVALAPVLDEIRTSLDFWQAQAPDAHLRRVVLTGGGARPDALASRLEVLVGVPVVEGRPFDRVDTSGAGLDLDALERASSLASVAVGLALSGEDLGPGARRISLVPTEIAVHRRERQQVALAAAGVAVFAALLFALYSLRSGQVSDAEEEARVAEARTAELQAQVAQLQDVELLETDIGARRALVTGVLAGDVSWTRLLNEVATVLPNDVWLTSFQGGRGAAGAPGSVTFAANGFDQTSTAHWLVRVSGLESLSGLWVPSSTRTATADGAYVTFTSSASLTPAAESSRAQRYAAGGD